jgi:hypothetical protein
MRKWIVGCTSRSALPVALSLLISASPAWAAENGASARDAIRALKALNSALSVGLTYRDYHQRLIETKIIVDQYVETPRPRERLIQLTLDRTMSIYQMAASIWDVRLANQERVPLSMIDALHQISCANLTPMTTRIREAYANSTDRVGVGADSSYTLNLLPLVWACAADGIREGERELAKQGAKR